MYLRLLDFLRCPACGGELQLNAFEHNSGNGEPEIDTGLLHCDHEHWYPIVNGVPRMLPDALEEHWAVVGPHARSMAAGPSRALRDRLSDAASGSEYDRRTRANFSLEWDNHDLGGRTWTMDLDDRVRWYFLEPLRVPVEDMPGMVMLDAGCGNGSQSVAYTEYGLEVIAMDLSSGVDHGHAFRRAGKWKSPEKVHFIQGDLQSPPLAPSSVDLIHSAGVLHHTPNTERTFRRLCPLLRPGGTFYVWLYKAEPIVTPVVNAVRAATTRMETAHFARMARVLAVPFSLFCTALDQLNLRRYPRLGRREAALALMDIFGAPYAHYHSLPEVSGWYATEGFEDVWPCNDDRRGFGVCGRRRHAKLDASESGQQAASSGS